jgi:hypothetical protein
LNWKHWSLLTPTLSSLGGGEGENGGSVKMRLDSKDELVADHIWPGIALPGKPIDAVNKCLPAITSSSHDFRTNAGNPQPDKYP